MVDLIQTAWALDADSVIGGPDWLDSKRFDVIATAPADSGPETLRTMLQELLADRFQLAIHHGTNDFPAYAMTVGKKLQIKPASETSEDAGCRARQNQAPAEPVLIDCHAITMPAFAKTIPGMRGASGYLFDYPVVDRTGLSGVWDFSIKWSPRTPFFPSAPGSARLTIFDAFEKQLGLNLKLTAVPTPVVVVDHVNEQPSGRYSEITGTPPARPRFEVASIKPKDPDRQGSSVGILPGGRVIISNDCQRPDPGGMGRHESLSGGRRPEVPGRDPFRSCCQSANGGRRHRGMERASMERSGSRFHANDATRAPGGSFRPHYSQ